MRIWRAVGNEVWESHENGDYLVCTVQYPGKDKETIAELIADAPKLFRAMQVVAAAVDEVGKILNQDGKEDSR